MAEKELLELRDILTTTYSRYIDDGEEGTLVFLDEMPACMRAGKPLHHDQSELVYMQIDDNSTIILNTKSDNLNSSFVKLADGERLSFSEIKPDSKEYAFLTEVVNGLQNPKKNQKIN